MGELLKLVPIVVSEETIGALEMLLDEAKAGRIVGLAWVALRPGPHFEGDIAGSVRQQIIYTRGALHALDDELGALNKPP